ncbi:MAG TPA: cytochrome c [Candidatus Acidoferrales bacterium]|nr:cytochrome c [Candidatus Acidoferrales bacterium]
MRRGLTRVLRVVVAGLSVGSASSLAYISMARAADAIPAAAMTEAKDIFANRCATCHGPAGKGDGPAGAALNPKPRDYGDAAWQKSVTDDQIEKIILEGGPAVGKSPLMPPNPDLASKPQVVKGLRSIVRGFGEKK